MSSSPISGLARLTGDEKWGLSEAGMAIGTPYYISPEQVRGETNIDIRADIYSLGATLYHMVTGKVPYGGETPNDVMRKHVDLKVQIVPPDHLNPKLSGGLGMVVETMMAKNREHRYQTPDDLILDLKCLQRGESPMIAGQKPETLLALAEGECGCGLCRRLGRVRGTTRRARLLRQQPQSHHRNHCDAPGRLGDHERHPLRRSLREPPRKPAHAHQATCRRPSPERNGSSQLSRINAPDKCQTVAGLMSAIDAGKSSSQRRTSGRAREQSGSQPRSCSGSWQSKRVV